MGGGSSEVRKLWDAVVALTGRVVACEKECVRLSRELMRVSGLLAPATPEAPQGEPEAVHAVAGAARESPAGAASARPAGGGVAVGAKPKKR
jgi:hypothetical protein